MRIICEKCNYIIDRDKIIEGQIVEEYKNIYGTSCPECGTINGPSTKPPMMVEMDAKMESLREEVREKLRKKLRRK